MSRFPRYLALAVSLPIAKVGSVSADLQYPNRNWLFPGVRTVCEWTADLRMPRITSGPKWVARVGTALTIVTIHGDELLMKAFHWRADAQTLPIVAINLKRSQFQASLVGTACQAKSVERCSTAAHTDPRLWFASTTLMSDQIVANDVWLVTNRSLRQRRPTA